MTHSFVILYQNEDSEIVLRILDTTGMTLEHNEIATREFLKLTKITPDVLELDPNSFAIFYGNNGRVNLPQVPAVLEVSIDADDTAAGDSAITWRHFEYTSRHPEKITEMFNKLSDKLLPKFQSN